MGRHVIMKSRVPKGYRHPDLDASLRVSRTRNEARLIQEARRLGVPTPIIYDIDLIGGEIVMQELSGPRVKDLLDSSDDEMRRELCKEIGRLVALLHQGGITHGDLTTSNMIHYEGRIWLIDFSLGTKNADLEEMGVDLHLLKEAFQSAHSSFLDCYDVVLSSYKKNFAKGDDVMKKIKQIEDRGRYT
ncbi:MAG: putative bifunctional tRNA threonylcarbamoyladenosine biosynthesis protein [Methanomassiliicoccales archaeon PtaU1.Bin124]|nr:MAG: putative bifunctional tRNA threonylcarbamoyladenosine biosynthesis protein [Methanomassiliicoccales archaeon PtaU1.Bin124]